MSDTITEREACYRVGLSASDGHRQWLRKIGHPVIATAENGRLARRYRPQDLEAVALEVAKVLTKHAFNQNHD